MVSKVISEFRFISGLLRYVWKRGGRPNFLKYLKGKNELKISGGHF